MTKICHMTSAHSSKDVRIFYKECTSLAKVGYDTYLVARGESREENGVHVVGIGQPSGGRLFRMIFFSKKIYKQALSLDAEIYHLHDPELLPYGLKLKRHGKKVIFDSHENTLEQMSEKQWIPRVIRPFVSVAYRHYAMRVFQRLDALISVTPHIVDELKAINRNTQMVTNYPLCEELVPTEKKSEDTFVLCFTGGIDRQWNHGIILKAIGGLENVRYLLCGLDSHDYLSELQALPGWHSVDYLGQVPHEEAKQLQRQSNVGMALLKPSNNTDAMTGTLGNTKLFEYMMSGLPTICTKFDLWKAIIERFHCGICVDENSQESIRNAVLALIQDPEKAKQMGQNGRKAVEQEFNWSTQEKVLFELYKTLSKT